MDNRQLIVLSFSPSDGLTWKKRKRVSHTLREVAQATKTEPEPQTPQLRRAAASARSPGPTPTSAGQQWPTAFVHTFNEVSLKVSPVSIGHSL